MSDYAYAVNPAKLRQAIAFVDAQMKLPGTTITAETRDEAIKAKYVSLAGLVREKDVAEEEASKAPKAKKA